MRHVRIMAHFGQSWVSVAHAKSSGGRRSLRLMYNSVTSVSHKHRCSAHQTPHPLQSKRFMSHGVWANEGVGTERVHAHRHQTKYHQRHPRSAASQIAHEVCQILVECVHAHLPMIVVVYHTGNGNVLGVLVTPHCAHMMPVDLRCARSTPGSDHTVVGRASW